MFFSALVFRRKITRRRQRVSRCLSPPLQSLGASHDPCVAGYCSYSVEDLALQVSKGGWFAGRAFVRTATVAGRLEGVLVASDALMVRSAGHCKGTIRYGELNVQVGEGESQGQGFSWSWRCSV